MEAVRARGRIDLAPTAPPPSTIRLVAMTGLAAAISIALNAALVAAATSLWPHLHGYSHFRLVDYGLLTGAGAAVAGLGWGLTVRITSTPRWLFLRLVLWAIPLLWLPDVWLLVKGEPGRAVVTLALMHVVVSGVSYNVLVRGAQLGTGPAPMAPDLGVGSRSPWVAMMVLVAAEFAVGIASLVFVPVGRPSGWLPHPGRVWYVAHTLLGAVLLGGAVGLIVAARRGNRYHRIGSVIGVSGVGVGAIGGLLAVCHSWRFAGLALMMVGVVVAFLGYLVPVVQTQQPK